MSRLTVPFARLKDTEQFKLIGLSYLFFKIELTKWHTLWYLFILTVVLCTKRCVRNQRWILLAAVVLLETGYFVGLHISSTELLLHPRYGILQNALHRLFLHMGAIALILPFEVFGTPQPSPQEGQT